ncbi:MAG: hypothetical protein JNK82_05025 [Myxococcaceae bacterium]|nr:hypothetical protein [Myxococcaceae bacterium]
MISTALALTLALPLAAEPTTVIALGGSAGDGMTPTLAKLRERLEGADPKHTFVVFTGNYMRGELPPKDGEGRQEAEAALLAHVDATRDFHARGGKVFYLPGNRDFSDTKAVKRWKKFITEAYGETEESLGKEPSVVPEAACAGSNLVKLDDELYLLLVNSAWWMEQATEDANMNDTCLVKSPKAFAGGISDELRAHRHHRVVIAAHHPLASYGEYGGAFTAAAHLDPFPIAGTARVLARQVGLVEQHQNYPLVQSYIQTIISESSRYGTFVFVGGHDPSLQWVDIQPQVQIIAGTSAKEGGPVVGAVTNDFAAPLPGWVELSMSGPEGWASFMTPGESKPLFIGRLPALNRLQPEPLDPPQPMPEGPVTATFSKNGTWNLPGVVRFFAGSFYADAFQVSLPYEVLDLDARGFKPYKIGGGQQSNSVRVKDPDGGDWAIRATTKEGARIFPYPLNKLTPMARLLEHAYTATHPEAALTVAHLADAAGIFTVHPELYYLPDQEALGHYRGYVSDEVVILEQRPKELKEGGTPPAHLGGRDENTKFKDWDEMVEKLLDKPWKHRLDDRAMLKARLLDVLVSDWDRHRGQWQFAANEDEQGIKVYSPVGMDRDQALANYDGALLAISKVFVPQARSLGPFNDDYRPMKWLNYNARDVDALALNNLDHAAWVEAVKELQAALTDEVIEASMARWHPETYALDGPQVVATLKARRDKLGEAADAFYRHQARYVDVRGSNGDDHFTMAWQDDGRLRVVVRRRGKPDEQPWFDRTFVPSETEEVRAYALDGDDVLVLEGAPTRKIGVRYVGGEGRDVVKAKATGEGHTEARVVYVYDRVKGMYVDPSVTVTDERSEVAHWNQYEQRENHELDHGMFIPGLMYNPDQGVFLGGQYEHVVQGFKKAPFAQRHRAQAYFATATLGAALDYGGYFPGSFELLDQTLDVRVRTPQYTRNFLGFTNRNRAFDQPRDFWRVRQEQYEARWGLVYPFAGQRARVGAQLLGQAFATERTPGRYVSTSPDISPDEFGLRGFVGGRFFAEVNTFDSLTLPRRGVALHASVEWRWDPISGGAGSSNHKVAGAVAVPFDRHQRVVLLSRVYLEGIVGRHPFYFAPTLGDPQLRAYAQQMFAGDVAFAHSNDLRVDVVRIGHGVPSTIGFNVSADHGRVFGGSVVGNDYHLSLGGGVWWSIADLFGVSISYHRSLDGAERFTAGIGPLFAGTGF